MEYGRQRAEGYSIVTDDELHYMIAHCKNDKQRGLIIVMANTGLRVSETVGLNVGDIWSPETGWKETVTVREAIAKMGKEAEVILLEETIAALEKVLAYNKTHNLPTGPNDPVFWSLARIPGQIITVRLNPDGTKDFVTKCRMGKRSVQKLIERVRPREDIHTHLLRHRFGRTLYKSTGDIILTMHQMRHSSLQTTQIYVSLSKEEMKTEFLTKMKRIFPVKKELEVVG